jgi:hypothetical protein
MKRLTPEELAETITDFVNNFSDDNRKAFIKALFNQHRTLQQSTIRLFLETIEAAAGEEYRTDGRNENTKQICQEVVQGFKMVRKEKDGKYYMETGPSRYLPYI